MAYPNVSEQTAALISERELTKKLREVIARLTAEPEQVEWCEKNNLLKIRYSIIRRLIVTKPLKIVRVDWIDSKSGGVWEYLDDVKFEAVEVTTVGIVLDNNDKCLTIAHSLSGKQCCGRITIPKKAIVGVVKELEI